MTAIDGACSIVSLVRESDIFVANTGDCRVVVGHQVPNGTWQAIPLSVDQNAQHPGEVERIKKAHPGEENTVIMNGRVLGNLMPFRTFGDVDFKWEKKYLESVGIPLSPFYLLLLTSLQNISHTSPVAGWGQVHDRSFRWSVGKNNQRRSCECRGREPHGLRVKAIIFLFIV